MNTRMHLFVDDHELVERKGPCAHFVMHMVSKTEAILACHQALSAMTGLDGNFMSTMTSRNICSIRLLYLFMLLSLFLRNLPITCTYFSSLLGNVILKASL